MPKATTTCETEKPTDVPVYWFVKLEFAIAEGDFLAAAEAQRQLAILGVQVRYGRPKQLAGVAHASR